MIHNLDGGVVLMEVAEIRVSAAMVHFQEPARQMKCFADTQTGSKYFDCMSCHILCKKGGMSLL